MEHGQISKNKSINEWICDCFRHLHVDDVKKFLRKFRQQPHDEEQVLHTFRELIFGAFLAKNAVSVRYDLKVNGATPDWCLTSDGASIQGMMEVINFHTDQKTETGIREALRARGFGATWGGEKDDRLYDRLQSKCVVYKNLVERLQVHYVIGLFIHFFAPVSHEEIREAALMPNDGLFHLYPHVSGVLYCAEGSGYHFYYLPNPYNPHKLVLPDGIY